MEFTVNKSENEVKYALRGQLTFSDADKFDKVLAPLRESGLLHVDFDLYGLDFVDSTGMSLFVHAYDASQDYGFALSVSNARERVRAALERAGFNTLLTMR